MNIVRRLTIVITSLFFAAPLPATDLDRVVGAVHISGAYNFNQPWPPVAGSTQKYDYLNEGAAELQSLGTRVIKVWLHPAPRAWYWFTDHPGFNNDVLNLPADQRLREIARRPYPPPNDTAAGYKLLFDNPHFTVYIMNVMANIPVPCQPTDNCPFGETENRPAFGSFTPALDGMTPQEIAYEKNAIRNLAEYLLTQYAGTGKTFIISNWEGDHMLYNGLAQGELPTNERLVSVQQWLNARQDGVTEARAAVGTNGVNVYYATEFNSGRESLNPHRPTLLNDVIAPKPPLHDGTHSDLYSWSSWDNREEWPEPGITTPLDYFESKAPDSAAFGKFNLYIGEYGVAEFFDCSDPEVNPGPDTPAEFCKTSTRRFVERALAWGIRYLTYWTLYAKGEFDPPYTTTPPASELGGLWLVRPDGTKPPVYDYLQSMTGRSAYHYALRASDGHYVSAIDAGGNVMSVHAPQLDLWERLTIVDRNGGALMSGDKINILTQNGHYLRAINGGGDTVDAQATDAQWWEELTIQKRNGTGEIRAGDEIAIRAYSGHYFVAENGGGSTLDANRPAAGPWETFRLVDWMCPQSIASTTTSFPSAGGTGTVSVAAPGVCSWTATSDAAWITVTSGSGAANGTASFTVAPNTGVAARSAAVNVHGSLITITQAGASRANGDANGDGVADIFWHRTTGENYLWLLSHTGTLQTPLALPTLAQQWSMAATGDFNADGRTDVFLRDTQGNNYLWLLDGNTIIGLGPLPPVDTSWNVQGAGDFDGNGTADILWRRNTGEDYVWLLNGTTLTGNGPIPTVDTSWTLRVSGDVDGDGKADLLLRQNTTGSNFLWTMNGTSVAAATALPAVDTSWDVAATPDLNGDGRHDIFWRRSTGDNYAWLLDGPSILALGALPPIADTTWQAVAWGDFDGDGDGDICWRRQSTGEDYLWRMSGITLAAPQSLPAVEPLWSIAGPR